MRGSALVTAPQRLGKTDLLVREAASMGTGCWGQKQRLREVGLLRLEKAVTPNSYGS